MSIIIVDNVATNGRIGRSFRFLFIFNYNGFSLYFKFHIHTALKEVKQLFYLTVFFHISGQTLLFQCLIFEKDMNNHTTKRVYP